MFCTLASRGEQLPWVTLGEHHSSRPGDLEWTHNQGSNSLPLSVTLILNRKVQDTDSSQRLDEMNI